MQRLARILAPIFLCFLLLAGSAARAHDPSAFAHYKHTAWTGDGGAPIGIYALAHGRDGYLWIGSDSGLYRFDGVRFERMPMLERERLRDGAISALFASRSGDLWIGYQSGRIAILRGGKLIDVSPRQSELWIWKFYEDRSGAMWVLTGTRAYPVLRYADGRWTVIDRQWGVAGMAATTIAESADGSIWLRDAERILFLPRGGHMFQTGAIMKGRSYFDNVGLAADAHGRIWLSGSIAGTVRLPDPSLGPRDLPAKPAIPSRAESHFFREVFFDRNGAIWGVTSAAGLIRIDHPETLYSGEAPVEEVFTAKNGLSSDNTRAVLEDPEGNIWVGTSAGLDRFRPANIRLAVGVPPQSRFGYIMLNTRDGTVYVADADSVFRARPRREMERLLTGFTNPMTLCEANDGTIWLSVYEGFLRTVRGRFQRVSGPAQRHSYFDCAVSRDGGLWFSLTSGGLVRYANGTWTYVLTEGGGRPNMVGTMLAAPEGGVLAYLRLKGLVRIDPGRVQTLWNFADIPGGDISLLYRSGDKVLIGTGGGLARYAGGRIVPLRRDYPWLRGITGMVESGDGYTWMMSRAGILRIASAELGRSFDNPEVTLRPEIFTFADGLPASLQIGASHNAGARSADGRLLFITTDALVQVDPAHLFRNSRPPPVKVTALAFARTRLRDPVAVTLPVGVTRIEIGYTALSLSVPERVRFRYRLEGVDDDWIDPGARREAFYTNLAPGTYRFRVIASNNDGVWNREGAILDFTIPPTFFHSIWFKLLCALAIVAIGWGFYALRLVRVTARLRSGFEVRLAERERIARELHDTLLQGFQGLVLRFQAAANGLPADLPARARIDDALRRADVVLAEGRDSVRELRTAAASDNFTDTWIAAAAELGAGGSAKFDLTVEGTPRPLHPLVRDELQRIGEEAIRNAFLHSGAGTIQAMLSYGRRQLRLLVSDDGVGLPSSVAAAGERPGHYGLIGMRERAARLGGVLTIVSREGAGTEVLLSVPGQAAYAQRWRSWWIPSFLRARPER